MAISHHALSAAEIFSSQIECSLCFEFMAALISCQAEKKSHLQSIDPAQLTF